MCIAVFKPPGTAINEENLKECWQGNPDGAGFAYIEDGKVVMSKGYMTLKEFMAGYKEKFVQHSLSPFLIHFRIRSQGDKSPDNTHPFPIEGGAMIHNGTLSGTGSQYGIGPSDTALFAKKYSPYLTYSRLAQYREDWEKCIGTSNKMAFLYNDGRHIILNSFCGTEDNGVWYSNSGFKVYPSSTAYRQRRGGTDTDLSEYMGGPSTSGYAEGYYRNHGQMH